MLVCLLHLHDKRCYKKHYELINLFDCLHDYFIVVIIVKGDTKLGHQYRSHEVIMVYTLQRTLWITLVSPQPVCILGYC